MNKYNVFVSDSAYYPEIEAENEQQAHNIAWEWFSERKPDIKTVDKVCPKEERKHKLIIHETDCHGCGRAYYNGKCTYYAYDDDVGDLKSAVLGLIELGFINPEDVAIYEDDKIYGVIVEFFGKSE